MTPDQTIWACGLLAAATLAWCFRAHLSREVLRKLALGVCALGFVLTLLASPWQVVQVTARGSETQSTAFGPIFAPPALTVDTYRFKRQAVSLQLEILAVEWAALGISAYLLRPKP